MRDKHYKNRTIRLADDVWEGFKEDRRKSGKSWNLFIKSVSISLKTHKQDQQYGQKKDN